MIVCRKIQGFLHFDIGLLLYLQIYLGEFQFLHLHQQLKSFIYLNDTITILSIKKNNSQIWLYLECNNVAPVNDSSTVIMLSV